MEELIAAGVIKNLDTGEIFSETTSVRNLDTGEIMSLEHLAKVYAGAPENAFDWCERRHYLLLLTSYRLPTPDSLTADCRLPTADY